MRIDFLVFLITLASIWRDSKAVKIVTSSCIDKTNFVKNGSHCHFSCDIKGLSSVDYFTIDKIHFVHRGLTTAMELKHVFPVFSSYPEGGLDRTLTNTGRYQSQVHTGGHGATIKISPIMTGDSGGFVCTVKTKHEKILATATETFIPVLGAFIRANFGRVTASRNMKVQEYYPNNSNVIVTLDDLNNLAFIVDVTGTMPVRPNVTIIAHYPEEPGGEDVTSYFSKDWHNRRIDFDYTTGIMNYTHIREYLGRPNSSFLASNLGKPNLTGTYQYANIKHQASITLDLHFPPRNIKCPSSPPALLGKDLVLTCRFSSNPPPLLYSVKLSDKIKMSADAEELEFSLQHSGHGWSYILTTVLKNYSIGLYKSITLSIKNDYGKSSFVFPISDVHEKFNVTNFKKPFSKKPHGSKPRNAIKTSVAKSATKISRTHLPRSRSGQTSPSDEMVNHTYTGPRGLRKDISPSATGRSGGSIAKSKVSLVNKEVVNGSSKAHSHKLSNSTLQKGSKKRSEVEDPDYTLKDQSEPEKQRTEGSKPDKEKKHQTREKKNVVNVSAKNRSRKHSDNTTKKGSNRRNVVKDHDYARDDPLWDKTQADSPKPIHKEKPSKKKISQIGMNEEAQNKTDEGIIKTPDDEMQSSRQKTLDNVRQEVIENQKRFNESPQAVVKDYQDRNVSSQVGSNEDVRNSSLLNGTKETVNEDQQIVHDYDNNMAVTIIDKTPVHHESFALGKSEEVQTNAAKIPEISNKKKKTEKDVIDVITSQNQKRIKQSPHMDRSKSLLSKQSDVVMREVGADKTDEVSGEGKVVGEGKRTATVAADHQPDGKSLEEAQEGINKRKLLQEESQIAKYEDDESKDLSDEQKGNGNETEQLQTDSTKDGNRTAVQDTQHSKKSMEEVKKEVTEGKTNSSKALQLAKDKLPHNETLPVGKGEVVQDQPLDDALRGYASTSKQPMSGSSQDTQGSKQSLDDAKKAVMQTLSLNESPKVARHVPTPQESPPAANNKVTAKADSATESTTELPELHIHVQRMKSVDQRPNNASEEEKKNSKTKNGPGKQRGFGSMPKEEHSDEISSRPADKGPQTAADDKEAATRKSGETRDKESSTVAGDNRASTGSSPHNTMQKQENVKVGKTSSEPADKGDLTVGGHNLTDTESSLHNENVQEAIQESQISNKLPDNGSPTGDDDNKSNEMPDKVSLTVADDEQNAAGSSQQNRMTKKQENLQIDDSSPHRMEHGNENTLLQESHGDESKISRVTGNRNHSGDKKLRPGSKAKKRAVDEDANDIGETTNKNQREDLSELIYSDDGAPQEGQPKETVESPTKHTRLETEQEHDRHSAEHSKSHGDEQQKDVHKKKTLQMKEKEKEKNNNNEIHEKSGEKVGETKQLHRNIEKQKDIHTRFSEENAGKFGGSKKAKTHKPSINSKKRGAKKSKANKKTELKNSLKRKELKRRKKEAKKTKKNGHKNEYEVKNKAVRKEKIHQPGYINKEKDTSIDYGASDEDEDEDFDEDEEEQDEEDEKDGDENEEDGRNDDEERSDEAEREKRNNDNAEDDENKVEGDNEDTDEEKLNKEKDGRKERRDTEGEDEDEDDRWRDKERDYSEDDRQDKDKEGDKDDVDDDDYDEDDDEDDDANDGKERKNRRKGRAKGRGKW